MVILAYVPSPSKSLPLDFASVSSASGIPSLSSSSSWASGTPSLSSSSSWVSGMPSLSSSSSWSFGIPRKMLNQLLTEFYNVSFPIPIQVLFSVKYSIVMSSLCDNKPYIPSPSRSFAVIFESTSALSGMPSLSSSISCASGIPSLSSSSS